MLASFIHFQSSKNPKVKAHSEYRNENIQPNGSIPETCPKVFQEFWKILKIERRASVIKYIFDEIADMQYLY